MRSSSKTTNKTAMKPLAARQTSACAVVGAVYEISVQEISISGAQRTGTGENIGFRIAQRRL
jgi:hypothetical protein